MLGLLDRLEKPIHQSEQRIMLHLRAQAQILAGDLEGAKSNLLLAERYYGEHVGLLAELTCLYYQTGEIHQWRQCVLRLQARLAAIENQLSVSSWARTKITLGKFLEEDGRVAEAMQAYHQSYLRCKQTADADLTHLSLIQLLRLEALFSRGPELGQWYRELLAQPPLNLTFDLMVEREHTLLLTEIELIGPQHAWSRLQALWADPRTQPPDRRLLLADYLAEAASRGFNTHPSAQEMLPHLLCGDAFEREVAALINRPADSNENMARLNQAAPELSWASHLRLLTLHHQLAQDPKCQAELANKLSILLSTLSPSSRFYWMKRIQSRVFNDDLSFEFNRHTRTVYFQGKALDMSKRRTLCAVFEKLCAEREIDVDDLIRHLWQSGFSPEHLHRLRMTVHRLNQILFELSSIQRVIEMTADRVSLKGAIRIQAVG
ncbi:MAG: hypothetical protein AB7N80_11225 [Bdellovibrionales bacterium]